MTHKPLLIALDGPVSAGKSSLADAVARRLNILHLDTGAMYRAIGLAALQQGIDPADEQAVSNLVESGRVEVDVRFADGHQQTLLNGSPVDDLIRSQQVGSAASTVSRYGPVRRYLVARQQAIARQQSMIIDGRDIGTVVLPGARAKVFLTASPEVRARRRYEQIRGTDPAATYEAVLSELIQRDRQDRERPLDPLRQAEDAVLLDTTGFSFDQSVEAILRIVEAAYGQAR
ncbi:MAG: (d)CMP kinase [Clostridiales bacterium]|nr:(d)CMP kinase [Clostridiales bacterium]